MEKEGLGRTRRKGKWGEEGGKREENGGEKDSDTDTLINAISQLKLGQAAGPDGVCVEVFQFDGHRLAVYLTLLFNMCMWCGILPRNLLYTIRYGTTRYNTRCYFNVRSKADMSQLNLPQGNDN